MNVWLVWVGPRLNSVHATEDLAYAHKDRLRAVNGSQLSVRCEPMEVRSTGTSLEEVDRNARAYGWEVGHGRTLAEKMDMSPDNPFLDPDWREAL